MKPPCHKCDAACCWKQNLGQEYATHLAKDDYQFPGVAIFDPTMRSKEKVLPYKPNGACVFLDEETHRCKVYEQRPQACRKFNCTANYNADCFGGSNTFLERNPRIKQLIQLELVEAVKERKKEHDAKFNR